MSGLLLVTTEDCHLCEHAKRILDELGATWHEVDADSLEGGRLAATAPPLRPLLFTEQGRLVAYGRLSLRRLRKQFATEAA